ncbi:Disulfide bond formation protein D precursor [Shimia sp. SK013]|uniref:DsbA family protein n=1 Tax=Shimia sp. SK013 TaxID=1389006 RepID=UPI0006B641F1|nr:DsbA family protein [Shimia sp. SK013]KPA21207.1 Disulfide bond formation protein D precursor [Shimia sp. SK013]
MKRILPLVAVVVLAVAGGAYWLNTQQGPVAGVTQIEPVSSDGADVDTSGVVEMVMGAEDAKVTIIEYASFTCPHCASFHSQVLKPLKAEFVDTGKVKFIFRDVYFDRFGLWASMVARCGGQEKFFGIADILMSTQAEWSRAGDPTAIAGALRKTGRLAGLDDDTLQACLQDEDKAKALVGWYQENAAADDVNATPTLIIDGEKYSNMSYAALKELIEEKLAE